MTGRLRVALAAAMLAVGCCTAWAKPVTKPVKKPEPKLTPREERELLTALTWIMQGAAGATEENLKKVETGAKDLARQRAAARRAGIPVTAEELPRRLVPPDQNAAPIYVQLARLLEEKPLDPELHNAAARLGPRYQDGPANVPRARELLSSRPDVMGLIHQAVSRPHCDFQRDWSRGAPLLSREYSTMRTAARLLRAESYLLALEGRYNEAINNQRLGFRIAAHGASDRILIAHLVAIAYEAITLAGLEDILYLAGPNERIAGQVRASIELYRPRYPLRRALEREVVMAVATMDLFRRMGPSSIMALSGSGRSSADTKEMTALWKKSPLIQQWWRDLTDAGEADVLRKMRRAIAISERPYLQRRLLAQSLDKEVSSREMGVVGVFAAVLAPGLDNIVDREAQIHAAERVLIASAAVLAYRDRNGRWPERLTEALSPVPIDPFDSRPLKFRREGDGFVVYSVGKDGRYEGGKPDAPRDRAEAVFRYPAPPPQPPPPPEPEPEPLPD